MFAFRVKGELGDVSATVLTIVAPIMSTRALSSILLAASLMITGSVADYQLAGCSDEGCGIPCYMRPVEDPCHYQKHSPCNDDGSTDIEEWVFNLNSSLHRLENKLIQKGVIPAGDTCKPLKPINQGGVIYSDLLLSPGVIANYVCQDGYKLYGYPNRKCATDGSWIDSDKGDPVCEDMLVECTPLLNIPYGHVHYSSIDTTKIEPGDVVTYSCDPPYLLHGVEYRICMSNGTWSEEEPQCTEPPSSSGKNNTSEARNDNSGVIAGTTIGVLIAIISTLIIGIIVLVLIRKHRNKRGYEELSSDRNTTDGDYMNTDQSLLKGKASLNVKQGGVPSIRLQHDHTETITAEQ